MQNDQHIDTVKGEIIGDKIRHAIIDARKPDGERWQQKEVAEKVSITKDHLSRVLRGKSEISIKKLAEIARLFDVTFRVDVGGSPVVINEGCEKEY